MIYNNFFYCSVTQVLGRFFTDPDFSGSDPDFWPSRIRTQKKILIWIRKKTGSGTLLVSKNQRCGSTFICFSWIWKNLRKKTEKVHINQKWIVIVNLL